MRFITATAIQRRTVTLLAVFLLLAGGVIAYNSLQVELFPEIEFPWWSFQPRILPPTRRLWSPT